MKVCHLSVIMCICVISLYEFSNQKSDSSDLSVRLLYSVCIAALLSSISGLLGLPTISFTMSGLEHLASVLVLFAKDIVFWVFI